ncbi:MAG: hypothetical protein EOO72_08535 [Myxococcaceae bacterium]|nr:MAG: hypothetical protein EOO72_08535 [Myxococcaceae bacterium]
MRQTPTERHLASPYGRLDLTSETTAGKAVIKVKLRLDKTRIPAAEYTAFRAFCEQVDRALGERVVLGVK